MILHLYLKKKNVCLQITCTLNKQQSRLKSNAQWSFFGSLMINKCTCVGCTCFFSCFLNSQMFCLRISKYYQNLAEKKIHCTAK